MTIITTGTKNTNVAITLPVKVDNPHAEELLQKIILLLRLVSLKLDPLQVDGGDALDINDLDD